MRASARPRSARHGLQYEEVLGAAYEGLCKAAIGFDPALGHRPSSYVVPKVKGELLHHLRDTGFALHISHRLRDIPAEPVARLQYLRHKMAECEVQEWKGCGLINNLAKNGDFKEVC